MNFKLVMTSLQNLYTRMYGVKSTTYELFISDILSALYENLFFFVGASGEPGNEARNKEKRRKTKQLPPCLFYTISL